MASKRKSTAAPAPVVYGPEQGSETIVAAWQGLYHLFGSRWEQIELKEDGFYITNLSVGEGFDLATVLSDLSVSKHRIGLLPAMRWVLGEVPAHFGTTPASASLALTAWMTQFMKAPGRGKSPKYAKDAIVAYKEANGLAVARGRPRKPKSIDFSAIDEAALEGVKFEELESLQAVIDSVRERSATPA